MKREQPVKLLPQKLRCQITRPWKGAQMRATNILATRAPQDPTWRFNDGGRAAVGFRGGKTVGDCAAIAASLALQFGCPAETLRKALSRDARGRATLRPQSIERGGGVMSAIAASCDGDEWQEIFELGAYCIGTELPGQDVNLIRQTLHNAVEKVIRQAIR